MEIAGYIASIFIGISLGLIGGGGSILTVPVLVYLFHIDSVLATAYSLFIVGITSAVGSISYFKNKWIDLRIAVLFGIPSTIGVFLSRTYILPVIPEEIAAIGNLILTKEILILLLFAVLMILASYSMIKKSKNAAASNLIDKNKIGMVVLQGITTGLVTGLVGAGGGFLIIPVLVNVLKTPMKTAIGTSLLIIAFNSLMGFLFSLSGSEIQWSLLLVITAIAAAGIFIGSYFSKKIDGDRLKPAFGWFVLAMGVYIILKETWLH